MRKIRLLVSVFTLLAASSIATAQDSSPPTQTPSVTKNCTDMKPKAKQECLKVAKQMDRDSSAPETTSSSSSVDTVHHSSPVMQTQEEKAAAARATKSKGSLKSQPQAKPAPPSNP